MTRKQITENVLFDVWLFVKEVILPAAIFMGVVYLLLLWSDIPAKLRECNEQGYPILQYSYNFDTKEKAWECKMQASGD